MYSKGVLDAKVYNIHMQKLKHYPITGNSQKTFGGT